MGTSESVCHLFAPVAFSSVLIVGGFKWVQPLDSVVGILTRVNDSVKFEFASRSPDRPFLSFIKYL